MGRNLRMVTRSDNLCVFCAIKLFGTPTITPPARRLLNTSRILQKPSQATATQPPPASRSGGWGQDDTQETASDGGWGSDASSAWGSVGKETRILGRPPPRKLGWDSGNIIPTQDAGRTWPTANREGQGKAEQGEHFRIRSHGNRDRPRTASQRSPGQEGEGNRSGIQMDHEQQGGGATSRFSIRKEHRDYADGRAAPIRAVRAPNHPMEARLGWKHVKLRRDGPDQPDEPVKTQKPREENPELAKIRQEQEMRLGSTSRGDVVRLGGGEGTEWTVPRKPLIRKRASKPPIHGAEFKEAKVKDEDIKYTPSIPKPEGEARFDARRAAKFGAKQEELGMTRQIERTMGRRRMEQQRGRPSMNLDENIDDRALDRMERREQRKAERKARRAVGLPTPIILPDFISIGNLASILRVRVEDFIFKLQELGFEDFSNDHIINAEDAGLIAQEFNFEPQTAPKEEIFEDLFAMPEPKPEDKELMLNRPPVITIMGHVDHGKTTLLDYLRKSSVAAGEHGGITQHIGAFTVNMSSGRTITFLDTPGHAAFLDMRARGANVTDIVILVVAADDSVKPQTLEAIKHATASRVPMIVAITKVDKEDADPDRVKRDLAQHGVEVEDFGGDVQAIAVSGKTGEGMEDLEDAAITLADVLDVRADTTGQIEGWILESTMKRSGKVATVLVRRGTLKAGAIVVAGQTWAKVRTLRNEAGQVIGEALPGQPVEVDGWEDSPDAGAEVIEAPNLQRARQVCEHRRESAEVAKMAQDVAATNESRIEQRQHRAEFKAQEAAAAASKAQDGDSAESQQNAALARASEVVRFNESSSGFIRVPLVLRADVSGSVEALSAALLSLGNGEIRAEVLRSEVGQISPSDVELAETAQGVIVNFGLAVPPEIRRMADQADIKLIDGNVIYRVTDEVKALLEEKLPPLRTQHVVGEAEIAQVFEYKIKGKGVVPVAGCRIRNGVVEKTKNVRVVRGGQVIYDGTLASLKSHKKDVLEMRKGTECGMAFVDFTSFQEGDQVQCYQIVEERRRL